MVHQAADIILKLQQQQEKDKKVLLPLIRFLKEIVGDFLIEFKDTRTITIFFHGTGHYGFSSNIDIASILMEPEEMKSFPYTMICTGHHQDKIQINDQIISRLKNTRDQQLKSLFACLKELKNSERPFIMNFENPSAVEVVYIRENNIISDSLITKGEIFSSALNTQRIDYPLSIVCSCKGYVLFPPSFEQNIDPSDYESILAKAFEIQRRHAEQTRICTMYWNAIASAALSLSSPKTDASHTREKNSISP